MAGHHPEERPGEREAYHELCAYSLSLRDREFIHQHVVDAYAAQHADETTKPIGLAFALIGLYLHVERNVTGRDVQRAHMRLAQRKRRWPAFTLPVDRGAMTALDVMERPAGAARDEAIHAWAASVWKSWEHTRAELVALLGEYGY